ncbi:MAG: hypothetical protein JO322_03770 [Candidatus Eremiobacteraeota bacterium]|nr:hypothetical protein [Candidatus Eremiobacteraeota bacterium]
MMIALLAIHVLAAAFWLGSTLLLVGVVTPALAAAGPDVAQHFAPQLFQRVPRALGVAGATTILSGLWLYWIVSGGFNSGFARSTGGGLIGIGALCGIAAVFTGIITGRLQERGRAFAVASAALLVCALTLMIVGSRV